MIPKKINLMGHEIEVELTNRLVFEQDSLGVSNYREQRIILQEDTETYPIPESVRQQAFYHELLHFIFNSLGEQELRDNEKLVDSIAGLLNQALHH